MTYIAYSEIEKTGFLNMAEKIMYDDIHGEITIELIDGEITSWSTDIAINLAMFDIVYQLAGEVSVDDYHYYKTFTKDTTAKIGSIYLNKYVKDSRNIDAVLDVFWTQINEFGHMIERHLQPYQKSMSIYDLATLMQEPEMAKFYNIGDEIDPNANTSDIEKLFKVRSKELIEILSSEEMGDRNPLLRLIEMGILKTNQIPQVLMMFGCRSDVDGAMIKTPIVSSNLKGFANALEFATEVLSTNISALSNQDTIKKSQYLGRKLHLASSGLETIIPGDCGSTNVRKVLLTKENYKSYTYKYYLEDHELKLLANHEQAEARIGHTLAFRTPAGCKHGKHKTCVKCSSESLKYMPSDYHLGIIIVSYLVSVVSQMVLSTKHLISTVSQLYKRNKEVANYFSHRNAKLFLQSYGGVTADNIAVRIPLKQLCDLTTLYQSTLPSPKVFSNMETLGIGVMDKETSEYCEHIELDLSSNDIIPFLSKDVLVYLTNTNYIENKKDIIVPLQDFNFEKPFLRYVVLNEDMNKLIKLLESCLNVAIPKCTDFNSGVDTLYSILCKKMSPNIAHIELLLKSFVEGEVDADTDLEELVFNSLADTIERTSLTAQLGFQNFDAFMKKPESYLHPHNPGLCDPLFGIDAFE